MLPPEFLEAIQALLQLDGHPEELDDFVRAQEEPSARGLRANGLRVRDRETLAGLLAPHLAPLEPVAWCSDGFYYPADASPAGLVAYHAGLFYIQEPSAMLPAELLGARPGERILDLCAAPGGKSSRIAADLAGSGLLWANDLSSERIRPLVRNLELMGIANTVVSVGQPDHLAAVMPCWFDRVIVDAPCSGAGMIRRDARALASFQSRGPAFYAREQAAILAAAHLLLKPGGRLVYSTCTFAIEENEAQIDSFMALHPEYELEPVALRPGLSPGLPVAGRRIGIRIWPHRARGDGHFCAVLRKRPAMLESGQQIPFATATGSSVSAALPEGTAWMGGLLADCPPAFARFLEDSLSEQGREAIAQYMAALRLHEGHLHGLPMVRIPTGGMRLVKTGLYLGDLRQPASRDQRDAGADRGERSGRTPDRGHGRSRDTSRGRALQQQPSMLRQRMDGRAGDVPAEGFTPSHALSHVLVPADLRHVVEFPLESAPTRQYIRGDTLMHPAEPADRPPSGALVGIAADGHLIGFARQMPDGHLKNLYPPAWRKHS